MSISPKEDQKNSKPPERDDSENPPQSHCPELRLVSDENEEYEEQQTGIELSYVLKERDVYECLKWSSYLHVYQGISILVTAALTVLTFVLLFMGFHTYHSLFFYNAVFCVILLLLIHVIPYFNNKFKARVCADGRTIKITIYPDHIRMGETKNREIPMDGTIEYKQIKNMFVLYFSDQNEPDQKYLHKMLIIPIRCIKPRFLPDVQAILVAGTRPKKMPKF